MLGIFIPVCDYVNSNSTEDQDFITDCLREMCLKHIISTIYVSPDFKR